MKPRQRLEQKQSSRLYLRKRDHRDVIMNDIYHNAIWMKKTKEDGTVQDELVWCKYPQNALMNLGNGDALGWIDTDRQFSYAVGYNGGQRTARIYRLEDICVTFSAYSGIDTAYYTDDGIVWKRFKKMPNIALYDGNYFGENMLCSINGTTMRITLFEKDEEKDEWFLENYTTTIPNGSMYVCRTKNGCIVRTESFNNSTHRYSTYLYHVRLGHYDKVAEYLEQLWHIDTDSARDCSRTDYCAFGLIDRHRYWRSGNIYNDTYSNRILAFVSMNNGESWEVQELYSKDSDYFSAWYPNWGGCMDAFVRDDYMYIIYADMSENVHLFRTLTQSWNEVELPSWVDLPCLDGGGKCIASTTKEKIRIAIEPNQTSNYDIKMSDLIGRASNTTTNFNGASYNIKFKDGKLQNWLNEDQFIAFHKNGYVCIFDNLRFISSSKSFAYISASYSDTKDGRDKLQEYDYCVRGLTKNEESEVEE